MRLSIIITFYEGERFIYKLLSSIRDSYMASNKRISTEIIIVIDSPKTDFLWIKNVSDSIFENQGIHIKIIKNEKNIGVDRSRDIGTQNAIGTMFTCIDQDDFVKDTYFTVIERYLNNNVDFFILNGVILNLISKKSVPVYYLMPKVNLNNFILNNLIISPSFFIIKRKFVLDNNLHFTLPFTDQKGSDDWYFMIQLLLISPKAQYMAIKDKIICYCVHENNYSHRLLEIVNGSIRLLQSIEIKDNRIKRLIRIKIKSLNFSKLIYSKNKLNVAILNPFEMIKFLCIYCMDINRLIRYIHRTIVGLKIRE